MENNHQKNWEQFRDQELIKVTLILEKMGFVLDKKQVHISGERYLSGDKKLVLLARQGSNNKRVVIKISNDSAMIKEINDEWKARKILEKINFAYHVFFSPQEILFTRKQDYTIFITEFISQKLTFLERPLEDQFFIALKAFEAQEAIHATTYEHANIISQTFGIWKADTYLEKFEGYSKGIKEILIDNTKIKKLLEDSRDFLQSNLDLINLYTNFLTHWDFVPHNFRITGNDMYLLDHSSIRFGNKYEGWARFINFMTLYNQALEKSLLDYIKNNRGKKEYQSFRLMRVFRLSELIWYYTKNLKNAAGNLKTLNKKRIDLWINVLESVLEDRDIDRAIIEEFNKDRDLLRSEEEKQRQEKLH